MQVRAQRPRRSRCETDRAASTDRHAPRETAPGRRRLRAPAPSPGETSAGVAPVTLQSAVRHELRSMSFDEEDLVRKRVDPATTRGRHEDLLMNSSMTSVCCSRSSSSGILGVAPWAVRRSQRCLAASFVMRRPQNDVTGVASNRVQHARSDSVAASVATSVSLVCVNPTRAGRDLRGARRPDDPPAPRCARSRSPRLARFRGDRSCHRRSARSRSARGHRTPRKRLARRTPG